MDKKSLRKLYIEKRRLLSTENIDEQSSKIFHQFSKIALSNIRYIHLFYPIAGKGEVDVLKIASWIRHYQPQIRLVLSRIDLFTLSLVNILWQDKSELITNKWGITEPLQGIQIEPNKLDLIIVPLLAYDVKGNRVGYGKGFYDKFLAKCRTDVLKVGVSFFPPEPAIDDIDEHDVPLDCCITPFDIIHFGNVDL